MSDRTIRKTPLPCPVCGGEDGLRKAFARDGTMIAFRCPHCGLQAERQPVDFATVPISIARPAPEGIDR